MQLRFRGGSRVSRLRIPDARGRLSTSMCSGTKPIDKAADDLSYIRTAPSADHLGSVSGTVERFSSSTADRGDRESEPAEGIRIEVKAGELTLAGISDYRGQYEIAVVPPGEYEVTAAVPDAVKVYQNRRNVRVPAPGCVRVHFSLTENGRISGRIVLADGTPVADTWIGLVPLRAAADQDTPRESSYTSTTAVTGVYQIDGVPPGKYHLVVNADDGPSLWAPFLRQFYPGAADEARATYANWASERHEKASISR